MGLDTMGRMELIARIAELEALLHAERYAHSGSATAKFEARQRCDQLAAQNAMLREALDYLGNNLGEFALAMPSQQLADMVSNYATAAFQALTLPDLSTSVLKARDLKDAARYRWLRASDFDVFGSPHAVDLAGEELDQAIDAAMLGANAKVKGGRDEQN